MIDKTLAKPQMVCFAGQIGSGKSTVARAVAARLHWKCASFGDYVRSVAVLKGADTGRASLQRIGQSLIDDGWEPFCRSVLISAGWSAGDSLVVDGIRHIEALETLKCLAGPTRVCLVFVSMTQDERIERVAKRDGTDQVGLGLMDRDLTENQVLGPVLGRADVILDGTLPASENVDGILKWLYA